MPKIRNIFRQSAHNLRQSQEDPLASMALETYEKIQATEAVASLREQIFIIQVNEHGATLLHPDPAKKLEPLVAATEKLEQELADSKESGRTFCYFDEKKPDRRFLVINTSGKVQLIHPDRDLALGYDHELGHAIIRDGLYKEKSPAATMNTAECIADAYAALRLYQRFGTDIPDIHNLATTRTLHLIFGDGQKHFTAPVLEKIIAHSETIDYTALTPQETIDLARRFALLYAPNPGLTERLANTFNAHIKGADLAKPESLFPFAKAILETPFPPVFKYGSTALSALLSGQLAWDKKYVTLEGPQWDAVREKLTARQAQFETEEELFGLAHLPRKKPAVSAGLKR